MDKRWIDVPEMESNRVTIVRLRARAFIMVRKVSKWKKRDVMQRD